MRAIAKGMDPAIVRAVDARLDGVEASAGVRIPWAIESGSRAWGFPSLLRQSEAAADVQDAAAELIAVKAVTREMGEGTVPGVLDEYVAEIIATADPEPGPDPQLARRRDRAEHWFRTEIAR
ncbi:DNA polymerase beta superfamily protein [Microbacterium gorillae]|uniref:DNA polymerase beta superfamily protein n=1 Tax=Microbacterium gorillae TaxID=1231063 RepID=UPI00058FFA0C|nr:nucleotidyltransferase domain-containing protein [Microbacterium gorillae]